MADIRQTPETEALAAVISRSIEPRIVDFTRGTSDGAPFLLIPQGTQVIDVRAYLDKYLPAPERKRGTSKHAQLSSFIDHANRFKDEGSAVFVSPNEKEPFLLSVIDYHAKGPKSAARHGEHRGMHVPELSTAWKTWSEKDGAAMSQEAFAAFLEEHVEDLSEPPCATIDAAQYAEKARLTYAPIGMIHDLARGLEVNVSAKVASTVNLSTGEGRITYEEEHAGRGGEALRVPNAFLLAIEIFKGYDRFEIPVRLRYRATGGSIRWSLSVYRREHLVRLALESMVERVKRDTELPVFIGMPESARE